MPPTSHPVSTRRGPSAAPDLLKSCERAAQCSGGAGADDVSPGANSPVNDKVSALGQNGN